MTAVVDAINALLEVLREVPAPVKRALAGFAIGASAVAAFVGLVLLAKAAIGLLGLALGALGVTAGGLAMMFLPAIAIAGALALTVAGLRVAFQKNLGGLADATGQATAKASLFFRGLRQLIDQGGFSDAVRAELGKAENRGLKRFVIAAWQVAYRLGRIWEGIRQGFASALEAARPVFEAFVGAMRDLGREGGLLFAGLQGSAAGLPSDKFRDFGAVLGSVFGRIATVVIREVSVLGRLWAGVLGGFRSMREYVGPAVDTLVGALGDLAATWRGLTGATDRSTASASASTSTWRTLGELIGKTVGGLVTLLALAMAGLAKVIDVVLTIVRGVRDAVVWLGTVIGETFAKIYLWFTETLPKAIRDAVRSVRSSIAESLTEIPDFLLPGNLASWKRIGHAQAAAVPTSPPAVPVIAAPVLPAVVEASARGGIGDQLEARLKELLASRDAMGNRPFVVNVQVDGETVARAVKSAERDVATRSFSPVPSY